MRGEELYIVTLARSKIAIYLDEVASVTTQPCTTYPLTLCHPHILVPCQSFSFSFFAFFLALLSLFCLFFLGTLFYHFYKRAGYWSRCKKENCICVSFIFIFIIYICFLYKFIHINKFVFIRTL